MWRREKWKWACQGSCWTAQMCLARLLETILLAVGCQWHWEEQALPFHHPKAAPGAGLEKGEGRVPPTEAPLSFPCTFSSLLSLGILTSLTPAQPLAALLCSWLEATPVSLGEFSSPWGQKNIRIDYFSSRISGIHSRHKQGLWF